MKIHLGDIGANGMITLKQIIETVLS